MAKKEEIILEVKSEISNAKKEIDGLTLSILALEQTQRKLEEQLARGEISQERFNRMMGLADAKIKENRISLENLESLNARRINTITKLEGRIAGYRDRLAELSRQYEQLTESEKNSKEGRELLSQITELNRELTVSQDQFKRTQEQIQNYENQILSAMGMNDGFVGSLVKTAQAGGGFKGVFSSMITSAGNFGKALLSLAANPVVLTLMAIVLAVQLIVAAFKKNEDATKKLDAAMAGLKNVFNILLEGMKPLTDFISDVLVGAINVAMVAVETMISALSGLLSFLGIEGASEGLDKFNDKIKDTVHNNSELTNAQKELAKAAEELAESNERVAKLTQAQAEETKATQEAEKAKKALKAEEENLKKIIDDSTQSKEEHAKASKRLEELQNAEKLADENLAKSKIALKAETEKLTQSKEKQELQTKSASISAEERVKRTKDLSVSIETLKVREELLKKSQEELKGTTEDLNEKIDDTSLSYEERIKAAEDLKKATETVLQEEIDLAEEAKRVAEERVLVEGMTEETMAARAQATQRYNDALKAREKNEKESSKRIASIRKEAADKAQQAADKERERINKQTQERRALEDAQLAVMEEGLKKMETETRYSYDRQIEDLNKRLREEKDLTEQAKADINERIKIIEGQRDKALENLSTENWKKQSGKTKTRLTAQLEYIKKNSEEELDIKRKLLQEEKQAAILNAKDLNIETTLIEAKFRKEEEKLEKEHQESVNKEFVESERKRFADQMSNIAGQGLAQQQLRLELKQKELASIAKLEGESDAEFLARKKQVADEEAKIIEETKKLKEDQLTKEQEELIAAGVSEAQAKAITNQRKKEQALLDLETKLAEKRLEIENLTQLENESDADFLARKQNLTADETRLEQEASQAQYDVQSSKVQVYQQMFDDMGSILEQFGANSAALGVFSKAMALADIGINTARLSIRCRHPSWQSAR